MQISTNNMLIFNECLTPLVILSTSPLLATLLFTLSMLEFPGFRHRTSFLRLSSWVVSSISMILNTVCAIDAQIDFASPEPQNGRLILQWMTAGPQTTSFHSMSFWAIANQLVLHGTLIRPPFHYPAQWRPISLRRQTNLINMVPRLCTTFVHIFKLLSCFRRATSLTQFRFLESTTLPPASGSPCVISSA